MSLPRIHFCPCFKNKELFNDRLQCDFARALVLCH
uniref:Uncharacterized protein n=1 Tax=Anguilla anguilla TaxID=7936 RepID=A0A0E9T645_ANGAN